MRWSEIMEGRSDDLFRQYGGKVMHFGDLPVSAQKALDHVSTVDGWDINTDTQFGYVVLPIEAIRHACMTAPDNDFPDDFDGDWDAYHDWYWSGEQDAHYANHLTEMWPVILDDGEGILDGWHRLHWYHRNGVEQVPAILFLNPDELTESRKRRKRRKPRAPYGIGYGYYGGWCGVGNDSGQGPIVGGGDMGGGGGGE